MDFPRIPACLTENVQVPRLEFARELLEHPLVALGPAADDAWTPAMTLEGLRVIVEYALQVGERVTAALLDELISAVDAQLSAQMDEILHEPTFQAIESGWRGLRLLVDRTPFHLANQNQIFVLDASKGELERDLQAPLRADKLHRVVFDDASEIYGREAFGAIIANYSFGPSAPDIALLHRIADIVEQTHTPFIAAAGPQFWDKDGFTEVATMHNLEVFDKPSWEELRRSPNSNYIGLAMPRFLLREPYGPSDWRVNTFGYHERVAQSREHYLWGNACFAFATRLTHSFAKFGWCPYVIGPTSGGMVEYLPIHSLGYEILHPPVEIVISDSMLTRFSEEGFIPLVWKRGTADACFVCAPSVQMPLDLEDTKARTNFRLGTQLPYLFLVSRIAHHIVGDRLLCTGGGLSAWQLERWLTRRAWQYGSIDDPLSSDQVEIWPLHGVTITVDEVDREPGWFSVRLELEPHIKFAGQFFQLSIRGMFKAP